MKQCFKCKNFYDLDKYWNNPRAKDGKQYSCKFCKTKVAEKWRRENKERRKQYHKEYERTRRLRPETYHKNKRDTRFTKYNISKEKYLEICNSQDNKCRICKIDMNKTRRGILYVDHCHVSGKVRGLLCQHCNSLLGFSKDNIEILENAIIYIKETGA